MVEEQTRNIEAHKKSTHSSASAQSPKTGGDTPFIWVGIIIAFLIVAVISYMIGFRTGSASLAKAQAQPSVLTSNNKSLPSQPIVNSSPTKINVSASKYFILPSEAASLIGSGGYYAYEATTPAQIAAATAGLLPSSPSYNITSDYLISYNSSSKHSYGGLQELILESRQSAAVYAVGMSIYHNAFNMTALKANKNITSADVGVNLTSGSMEYSFSETSSLYPGTNTVINGAIILGHTANTTVFAQISLLNSTLSVNQSRFAAMIASHLN